MFNKANKNIFHVSSLWSGKKRDRKISPEVGNLVEISKNHKKRKEKIETVSQ